MSPLIVQVNAHGADVTVGGTEKHLLRLGRLMPERGIDVAVVSAFPVDPAAPRPDATLHPTDWRHDGRRRVLDHLGDAASMPSRRVGEVLDRLRPDLVHTHNLPGIGTGIWELCRRRGIPVVHTVHDYHLLCARVTLLQRDGTPCCPRPRFCAVRARRLARWSPAVAEVIAVSDHVLRRHGDLFGAARATVIPNPFEPVEGPPPAPPGPALRRLGYIGAFEREKGIDRLLAAAPALAEAGVEVEIAGHGRLRDEVAAAAAGGSVRNRGVVRGADRMAFFAACDAGIMPSVWEEPGGPPNAMLEWLSLGRPVLASTRGGLGEAVQRLSGTRPLEPTFEGIVEAVAALREPDAWRATCAGVPRLDQAADESRWIGQHEQVYRRHLAGATP